MFDETWFRCIDWNCAKYDKKEQASRTNFWHHVMFKSTDRLLELVIMYDIVKFPHILNRYTLANLVTDYSKEPISSEIINKFRGIT